MLTNIFTFRGSGSPGLLIGIFVFFVDGSLGLLTLFFGEICVLVLDKW